MDHDVEVDLHIWCERETEGMRALYTLSIGERCLCRALPKEAALQVMDDYLDELNEEGN